MEAQELIYKLETELLESMAALLRRGSIGSAEWQAQALQGLGLLTGIQAKRIKENKDAILRAVMAELKVRAIATVRRVDGMTRAAGVLVAVPDTRTAQILARWESAVAIKLETIYGQMLRSAGTRFVEAVHVAVAKTALGVSGRKAVAEIVSGWGEQGLDAFRDAAGRHWTPEAYASVIVRSSSNQIAVDTQIARMAELGENLVEISSHLGARPKCEPYQGKIFWTVKPEGNYSSLYNDTSYGEPDGLFGVNCRHIMYPYFHGMKKTYKPYPKRENEKVYEQSQEQRKIERAIRRAKREKALAGDDATRQAAQDRVSALQAKMRTFIDDTGRRRDYDREQIRG